jgi:hypothetical protein
MSITKAVKYLNQLTEAKFRESPVKDHAERFGEIVTLLNSVIDQLGLLSERFRLGLDCKDPWFAIWVLTFGEGCSPRGWPPAVKHQFEAKALPPDAVVHLSNDTLEALRRMSNAQTRALLRGIISLTQETMPMDPSDIDAVITEVVDGEQPVEGPVMCPDGYRAPAWSRPDSTGTSEPTEGKL